MLPEDLLDVLQSEARQIFGSAFTVREVTPVGGGNISSTFRIADDTVALFVKTGPTAQYGLFEAEADGLRALGVCQALRVPQPLAIVSTGQSCALLLEWLDIRPLRNEEDAARAGTAVATLHRLSGPHYGWTRDNFVGSTPQANPHSENWPRFFVHNRLLPQLERAAQNGYKGELQRAGERVCDQAPALFLEYRPTPSLLHGDLWSGNIGVLDDGSPTVFDPACYWGDREADLAMTELFGGFPIAFYAAYRREWPLHDDYERRKPLYNLYHVLNHLNLFGRGYLAQAERMASRLAAELGR